MQLKLNLFPSLSNQRGDALVVAMVMVGLCMVSSLVMMSYGKQIESGSKRPRIKSMMSSTEAKVRSVLLTPGSYLNCVSSEVAGGRSTCDLNVNSITGLSRVMKDAPCPKGQAACGIVVKLDSFQKSIMAGTQQVSRAEVTISYEGTDYSMNPIKVVVDVPADILQEGGTYKCPDDRPQFNGFNDDGTLNCEKMSDRLPANEFVVSVDQNGLTTTSGSLPAADLTCSGNEYFDDVKWSGSGSITTHCTARPDPFTAFGFTPKPAPAGDVIYVPNP